MNWIRKFMKNFECEHEYVFVRNIYGDEINQCGGFRSKYQCIKCGKYMYGKNLYSKSNKNLKETLNDFYNEYYKNKHIDWTKEHEKDLYDITNKLKDTAANGLKHIEILFLAYVKTNDVEHFKQWLTENKLDYSCELYHQLEENTEMNNYKFDIRWA